jgi:pyruvate,water dikinase
MSRVRVDADRELATLEAQLSYVEAVLLRSLVTRTRALLRLRERMRAWFARTVAMMRRVVLDVDRRLCRLDPKLSPGAAFFCTPQELSSAVGNARADLGAIVLSRRAGWARNLGVADPPEIFVGSPPPLTVPSSRALTGEPVSGKTATGVVRIVDDALSGRPPALPGEVLVMRSLDVGIAPLFVHAAALVAECGGTISHGAVLARELGVPAVVGVADARTVLADGDRVSVDGERGVVERVEE